MAVLWLFMNSWRAYVCKRFYETPWRTGKMCVSLFKYFKHFFVCCCWPTLCWLFLNHKLISKIPTILLLYRPTCVECIHRVKCGSPWLCGRVQDFASDCKFETYTENEKKITRFFYNLPKPRVNCITGSMEVACVWACSGDTKMAMAFWVLFGVRYTCMPCSPCRPLWRELQMVAHSCHVVLLLNGTLRLHYTHCSAACTTSI